MENNKRTTSDPLVIKAVLKGKVFLVTGAEDFFNRIEIDNKGVDFKNQDRTFGLIPDIIRLTTETGDTDIICEREYVQIKEIPGKWDRILIDSEKIKVFKGMTMKQYYTNNLRPVVDADIAEDIAKTQDTVCEIKQTEEFQIP